MGTDGFGHAVRDEIARVLNAAAASNPCLAEHPLEFEFLAEAVPAEISADDPLVIATMEANAALSRTCALKGLDSWHDPANFTRAGTPMFCMGAGRRRDRSCPE